MSDAHVVQQPEATIDSRKAKEILEEEKRERVATCIAEVNEALDRNKCVIDVSVTLRANQILPSATIISRD